MAARIGKKTCTIRLGTAGVEGREIDLTDGRERIRVRITRVDTSKTFGKLGEEEVKGEGFGTRDELLNDLRSYYRNLSEERPVTVIWFEVIK
jgi:hypothetical protein